MLGAGPPADVGRPTGKAEPLAARRFRKVLGAGLVDLGRPFGRGAPSRACAVAGLARSLCAMVGKNAPVCFNYSQTRFCKNQLRDDGMDVEAMGEYMWKHVWLDWNSLFLATILKDNDETPQMFGHPCRTYLWIRELAQCICFKENLNREIMTLSTFSCFSKDRLQTHFSTPCFSELLFQRYQKHLRTMEHISKP